MQLSLLYMHDNQFLKCLAPIQKVLLHFYSSDD